MSVTVYLFPDNQNRGWRKDADDQFRGGCYMWCMGNMGEHGQGWTSAGASRPSYRITFTNEDDAIMFKLKFGV